MIAERVIANFNGTLKNTYKDGSDYWEHLRESKFILCPSGLGWDTYRAWEALVIGTIPILETYYREDGFYRTFDYLPVLWVEHFDNVTPSLLEEAYPKILSKAQEYKFEKLTNQWWVNLINSYRPSLPDQDLKQNTDGGTFLRKRSVGVGKKNGAYAGLNQIEEESNTTQQNGSLKNSNLPPTIRICDVTTLSFDGPQTTKKYLWCIYSRERNKICIRTVYHKDRKLYHERIPKVCVRQCPISSD